jgi:hypothetical protein
MGLNRTSLDHSGTYSPGGDQYVNTFGIPYSYLREDVLIHGWIIIRGGLDI